MKVCKLLIYAILTTVFLPTISYSQGCSTSFYFDDAANFEWANCQFYLGGGASIKVPFLPVIITGDRRAPCGTENFNKDIEIDAPLVFVGSGIVSGENLNSYYGRSLEFVNTELDVAGKIVVLCYDFPETQITDGMEQFPLSYRINEATRRGAAGIILFSWAKKYPFPGVRKSELTENEIPVVSMKKESIIKMFGCSGIDHEKLFEEWELEGKTRALELIAKARLYVEGAFETIESEHTIIKYRKGKFPSEFMQKVCELNEKSIRFILEYFEKSGELKWNKNNTVFFSDYDSKPFYTRHWGKGMAAPFGVYNVSDGTVSPYKLIVHENTHLLHYMNWQFSSSFITEGLAMHIQALVSDPEENNAIVREYIARGEDLPLGEIVEYNIGQTGHKTEWGYPAAGSFMSYLVETYGLKKIKQAYLADGNRELEPDYNKRTWLPVFGKTLAELEKGWREWLAK